MNRKHLIILSSICLLGLAGCGGQAAPSASSEESSSVSSEEGEGKIYLSESLPNEIAKGSSKALHLEDYVTVTGVSSWSVETTSSCVKVSGHDLIGTSYGDFEATIVAGTTRKTFSGSVVTAEKVSFNLLVAQLAKRNYSYYSDYSGFGFVNLNWYLEAYREYSSDSSSATYYLLDGAIRRGSMSDSYHIQLSAAADSAGNFQFADELDVIQGSAKSLDWRGFGEFGYMGSDFQFQVDSEGDPTGYFILENDDADENGDSKVSELITHVTGDNDLWISMMYYLTGSIRTKMNLAGCYRDGFLMFYPCSVEGVIYKTMEVGSYSYSTYVSVSNIGECDIPACDAWLESPVYPAKIAVAPIKEFFAKAKEAKSYAHSFYGQWYDPSTNADIEVPSGFKTSEGKELFPNYKATSFANADLVERRVDSIGNAESAFEDEGAPVTGQADVSFVHGNYLYSAEGTYASSSYSYQAAEKAEEPFSESGDYGIWDSTLVPYYLLNDGSLKLFSKCSFYHEEEKDGIEVYSYNDYGADMDYGYVGLSGLPYFGSMDCIGGIPYTPIYYIGSNEWYRYCDMTLSIAESYAQFEIVLQYGEKAYYKFGWVLSGIGTDAVSPEAKAVYASIVA